ncbi:MAG: AMP-binding protein, partial [Rhodoferax sp.]|nr:AMP-binding protein [Rhodoferax sp.]
MFLDLQVGLLAEPLSGRRWEPADVAREVALRVARFQRHGLTRGDRVFLPFGNRLEFFAELLAAWQLGACAVPIDARLTPFEVTTLVGAAQPRMAVVDDATDPAVLRALAEAAVPAVDTLDTGDVQARAGASRL